MQSMHNDLMAVIRRVAERRWCPATAGNYSVLLSREPMRMLMSPSGVDKALLTEKGLIEVSDRAEVLNGAGKASAEYLIHAVIYQERPAEAGCVLHTHTIWNTLLSLWNLKKGVVEIGGYEILKALAGVETHEHIEQIPVFANSQDMVTLSELIRGELRRDRSVKAVLLAGHGVYTWGITPNDAFRHLEALEFLFEVVGRQEQFVNRGGAATWPDFAYPNTIGK